MFADFLFFTLNFAFFIAYKKIKTAAQFSDYINKLRKKQLEKSMTSAFKDIHFASCFCFSSHPLLVNF